ncbi:MAG: tetratricopeptide repeat protein [Rubrivivax sp.]|jgi:predicted negative regulator of RcsB-dependent stress response|nr:tetratricopeptide repeat protein [Rubrivivax sp.]
MATQLDLQEQEQIDALKAFWNKYGNLVTGILLLAAGAYAGYQGWQYWQREQGVKAAAIFEQIDQSAAAGDAERAGRLLGDLQQRYASTTFAHQAALLAAKVQFEKGQTDAAKASLAWAADKGSDADLRTVARLRLAAVQAEAKQFDEALKTLDAAKSEGFEPLVADRRGDVLMLQGKRAEALVAYQAAWAAMTEKQDYRRVIEAKLTALGAAPAVAAAASASASGAKP